MSISTDAPDWFYQRFGVHQGPVSAALLLHRLRTGDLPLDTLIWRSGMTAWQPAYDVTEIALRVPPDMRETSIGSTPPRVDDSQIMQGVTSGGAATSLRAGAFATLVRRSTNRSLLANVGGLLLTGFVLRDALTRPRSGLGDLGSVLLGMALVLWIGRNLWRNLKWWNDSTQHPSVTELGPPGELASRLRNLEGEIDGNVVRQFLGATFTPNWIVVPDTFRVNATHVVDTIWSYPKLTTKFYFIVPVARKHSAVLLTRSGRRLEVTGANEAEVLEWVRFVKQRAPWAQIGYDERLDRECYTEEGRSRLVAAVDARRSKPSLT